MDRDYDIIGLIRSIVEEETKYLRHYYGQVVDNNDELKQGRVLVTIPAIGWYTQNEAQWAVPRGLHSLDVPKVGEWVEVYFISGSVDHLAYMGIALEMQDMIPKEYKSPDTHVIWQSSVIPNSFIKYLDKEKKLFTKADYIDISGKGITFNEGAEPFVLGNQLETFLNTLVSGINGALASKLDGGGTAGTLTPPAGILSTEIKGK